MSSVLHTLKKRLYFVVAAYFAFWAKFVLRRWRPRVVVITGSSGKTTLLHLVEAQLGDQAVYGHHANSAIGIPFHILGLAPNVPSKIQWIGYVLKAPVHAFRKAPVAKLYIVEADCDRPHEGAFTSKLLKPEVILWVSVYRTHSMNFDSLVKSGAFSTHEAAIAHEFGYFIEASQKLVAINGDQTDAIKELSRVASGVEVKKVSAAAITSYELKPQQTVFGFGQQTITVPGLHPKELGIALLMANDLLSYLGVSLDPSYQKFKLPPGRTNLLMGKKNTTLIDSTYNMSVDAAQVLLDLFDKYPNDHKWLVLGDILEQGSLEQAEHERLAGIISKHTFEHVLLLGPRMRKYTYPLLASRLPKASVTVFENTGDGLGFLDKNITGGEAILFKGARGIEGIVEQWLANPADASQLVRRGPDWVKRRQQWGLPK